MHVHAVLNPGSDSEGTTHSPGPSTISNIDHDQAHDHLEDDPNHAATNRVDHTGPTKADLSKRDPLCEYLFPRWEGGPRAATNTRGILALATCS